MFVATPGAAPIVHFFIDSLNDHVFTPVLRRPKPGQGVARAAHREFLKRDANKKIPDTSRVTRQQRRREERDTPYLRALTPAEFARRRMRLVNGDLCAKASRQVR